MVVEINDEKVLEAINSNEKVVIDCFAPWCGPCKMLSPVIDELASELETVKFYKLNVDDNEQTSKEYGIMSIPTVLFFENGSLKEKSVGFRTKEELKEFLGE